MGGYNVYRRNVDSNTITVRINTSLFADTLFRDSTAAQDFTYEYKVRVYAVPPAGGCVVITVYEMDGTVITRASLDGMRRSIDVARHHGAPGFRVVCAESNGRREVRKMLLQ